MSLHVSNFDKKQRAYYYSVLTVEKYNYTTKKTKNILRKKMGRNRSGYII